MRTPVFLLIVPAAVGVLATLGSQGSVSESGVWTDEDSGTLRIEGICEISPASVGCWDIGGSPKPELSEQVRASFQKDRLPLRFQYGKKNRYVVFDWKPKGAPEQNEPGGDRYWLFEQGMNYPGRKKAVMHLATEPSEKELEITIPLNVYRSEGKFKLKLQPGEKASVGDKSVEVLNVDKVAPENLSSPIMRNRGLKQGWRVRVEAKNVLLNMLQLNLPQLTASGQRFHYVDENGEPAQGLSVANSSNFPKLPLVSFVLNPKTSDKFFETNVNPEKIDAIEFTPSSMKTVEIKFKSIAADPKGGVR